MPNKNLSLSLKELFKTSGYFFVVFLPLLLATSFVTTLIYFYEVRKERIATEIFENAHIALIKEHIIEEFTEAVADLKVLATQQEVKEFLAKADLENLPHEVLKFSEIKGLYDQLRFLDETGMEIIRIDYNNGSPVQITDEDLQNKGHRYYFKESISLDKGEVYVSPFDLNVEQGEIEEPLKPMIRFATPIFDKNGNKRGIAVANFFGKHLLESFEENLAVSQGHKMLVNKDGYWLKGMKSEDEWGFMYDDKQNLKFGTDYPEEWARIKDMESGQFYSKKGLFTFTTIYPLDKIFGEEYLWKIIGHVPQGVLQENPRRLLFWIIMVDGFLIAVIAGGSLILSQSMVKRRQAEKKIFELNEILKLLNKILRHDILNDVTVVGNNIALYQQEKDESLLEDVSTAAGRSKATIIKMKELETAVASGQELVLVRVEEVVKEVQKKFPKMQFTIEGNGKVLADAALNSVLENIVRNAKLHGGSNKVDITIGEIKGLIEVRIADDGKGILNEVKGKLFQEGFKYGETGHTGLGLFIVRKTIERYGGSVMVEDNKPKGTVFVLRLPKVKES